MPKIRYTDLSGGMQRRTTSLLQKDNEADLIVNLHGDQIGGRKKRLGYSQVGNTLESGKEVNGIGALYQKDGTDTEYAVVNNAGDTAGQLKYNNAGTWTNLTSTIVASTDIEFATFIDYIFMVGPGTVTQSIDGGANNPSTSTNVTNAPKAKYALVYKDRLYLLNCNASGTDFPSRFYFSSIPSGAPLAITWTPATDFESFNEDDGEEITGAIVAHDRLYMWKESSFGYWDNTQMRVIGHPGCISHRTIRNYGGLIMWMDRDGQIWSYNGSNLEKVSRKIDDITQSLTANQKTASFAEMDEEHYKCYVGNLTIDGLTFNNCELCYHMFSNQWYINSYADDFTIYRNIVTSGTRRIYAGAADGEIHKLAEGSDNVFNDDNNPIQYYYKSKRYDVGVPEEKKRVNRVYPLMDQKVGAKFGVRVDGKPFTTHSFDNGLDVAKDGYTFQFILTGNDQHRPMELNGFVVDIDQSSL